MAKQHRAASPSNTLVTLVDGDCALCSGYAQFISAMDVQGRVYFETQQSDVGQALLRRANMPTDLSSIVTLECGGGHVRGFTKSTAVLRTFRFLGMPLVGERGRRVGKREALSNLPFFLFFLATMCTSNPINPLRLNSSAARQATVRLRQRQGKEKTNGPRGKPKPKPKLNQRPSRPSEEQNSNGQR